jgi:hypothetical protein
MMLARIIALVVAVGVIGLAGWYFWPSRERPPPPPAQQAAAAATPAKEGPRHPIAADAQPLPPLKESDPAMLEALAGVMGTGAMRKLFNLDGIIFNVVATVDNLPRESYATRLNPVKPAEGLFRTTGPDAASRGAGSEKTLAIAPANAARYAVFMSVVDKVDAAAAVGIYRRFYPLFQEAYVELGYPGAYFNDRLVEVIDHLLATPDVEGPIPLTVSHVLYEFANPELEALSAGQKAMLRVGRDNTVRLKAKLREIRAQVTAAGTPP